MSSRIVSYLQGVGTGYLKILVTTLVGLWMVPFTLKYLSHEEYGVFAVVSDILVWLGLMQLGTGASLTSRAAHVIGRGEVDSLSSLASTAFILQSLAALLMLIFGAGISLGVGHWFDTGGQIRNLGLAVFTLVLAMTIKVSVQVFGALLVASKKVHIDNLIAIGVFSIKTLFTIVFLLAGLKLMALAWAALISAVILSAVSYFRVKKYFPEVEISLRQFRANHIADLLGNGVWFTVGGLAGILILSLDRFMVGTFVSLEAVTAFIVTGKLYYVAGLFHSQLTNVARPYMGELHGQQAAASLANIYQVTFSISLILSVSMAMVIYVINEWFVKWWVGADLYLGSTISFLLALNFVLQSSVLPNRALLASTLYKTKIHSLSRLSEGVVNLALSVAWGMRYGTSGILWASIVSSTLFAVVYLNRLSAQYFLAQAFTPSSNNYYSYVTLLPLILLYYSAEAFDVWFLLSFLILLIVISIFLVRIMSYPQIHTLYEKILVKYTKAKKV